MECEKEIKEMNDRHTEMFIRELKNDIKEIQSDHTFTDDFSINMYKSLLELVGYVGLEKLMEKGKK